MDTTRVIYFSSRWNGGPSPLQLLRLISLCHDVSGWYLLGFFCQNSVKWYQVFKKLIQPASSMIRVVNASFKNNCLHTEHVENQVQPLSEWMATSLETNGRFKCFLLKSKIVHSYFLQGCYFKNRIKKGKGRGGEEWLTENLKGCHRKLFPTASKDKVQHTLLKYTTMKTKPRL